MATAAPSRIPVSKNKYKPVVDGSCRIMCPDCGVRTAVVGMEDDGTRYGCPKCGVSFSLEWER